ncbi:class I adenylate-forming enzyme family protein [Pacificimonas sp. ICDLI1SI03]
MQSPSSEEQISASTWPDPARDQLTAPGAPFELHEITLDGRRLRAFRNAPRSLGTIFQEAACHGDRICLTGLDYSLTYAEVLRRAAILKGELEAAGLAQGMRCAVAMHNRPEWVIGFIAIAALGATPVLINYRASPAELASAIAETESAGLIAEPEIVARLAPDSVVRERLWLTAGSDVFPKAAVLPDLFESAAAPALDPVIQEPEDEGVIIFTSGTSGHPKGALISHLALMNMAAAIDYATLYGAAQAGMDIAALAKMAAQSQPSAMLVFPLFHTAGVIAVLLPNLRRGGKMVMLERWRVEDALTLLEREKVSGFSGSPAMLWDLLKADRQDRDLSGLRFLSIGGQGISMRLLDELRAGFPGLSVGIGYGQTETGSVNGISGANLIQRPTATGRPLPIVDLRIVDEEYADVPPGEVGEVLVGGVTTMRGYCRRPAETAEVMHDGYIATGDLGRIDEDGYLHISDRKKNIVLCGGENIGCGEVEDAAVSHPEVEQAVAFGRPDDRLGETLHLAIIPADGCDPDPEAVQAHIGGQLARYKIPRSVHRVDGFPMNAMGKADRRALAAKFKE